MTDPKPGVALAVALLVVPLCAADGRPDARGERSRPPSGPRYAYRPFTASEWAAGRSGAPAPPAPAYGGPAVPWAVGEAEGLPPPAATANCRRASDCGAGSQGHGALCDKSEGFSDGAGHSVGLCRDACRTDDDCPHDWSCEDGLDPENSAWSGCVPAEQN